MDFQWFLCQLISQSYSWCEMSFSQVFMNTIVSISCGHPLNHTQPGSGYGRPQWGPVSWRRLRKVWSLILSLWRRNPCSNHCSWEEQISQVLQPNVTVCWAVVTRNPGHVVGRRFCHVVRVPPKPGYGGCMNTESLCNPPLWHPRSQHASSSLPLILT